MRISLDRADAKALRVDLPGSRHESIAIRSATNLRGIVDQSDAGMKLEAVAADSVELEAVHIALGTLFLSSASGATLTQLGLVLEQTRALLTLAAKTGALEANDLELTGDSVLVRGRVKLTAPELTVRGDEGALSSQHVEIADFVLRIGDLEFSASMLRGDAVKIGWGAGGFRLSATTLSSPVLRVNAADVQLTAGGVAVSALSLEGPLLSMASLAIQSGQAVIGFRPSSAGASPSRASNAPPAPPAEALFDWRALDTVSGQLDVDVAVDLTVPIIGRRKATHRPRVAIDRGTLDFRALESNLSKLEDALLDFSVRDGALVLERVNPLFPARGHGKPIIIWDVDTADHELAKRDRVRLSVLPQARLASDARDEGKPEHASPPSSIALRELGLLHINARLALAPGTANLLGQVRPRSIGSFILGGSVFHETGGSREGSALGELADLSAEIHQLVLGASRLDVASVKAVAISPIELAFADVNPTKLQLGLSGVVLEGFALTL